MRKAPQRIPDLAKLQAQSMKVFEADTISLDLELITPLFGGGVITKKVDEISWIRGSEVKASLRFWWRALFGHRYKNKIELHAAESLVFGSARGKDGEASPVAIVVKELSRPDTVSADGIRDARTIAYFPGQDGMGGEAPARLMPAGAKANLMLIFRNSISGGTSARGEILNALSAWLLFGGVGSRTRRGAGALAPIDPSQARDIGYPTNVEELDGLLKKLTEPIAVIQGDYFSLDNHSKVLRCRAGQTAQAAHINLLDHWRSFRQNRRHPNHWGGGQNWGQNRWPEADLIRDITGTALGNHRCHEQHLGCRFVPRALLGLPIIIHFPRQPQGSKYQLISRRSDRYGSPIWLGVARVWRGDSKEHYGLVAATKSHIPESDLIFEIEDRGRKLQTGPLKASYPGPRTPRSVHEPEAWPVVSASQMLENVAEAFMQPRRGHESVPSPHFIAIH